MVVKCFVITTKHRARHDNNNCSPGPDVTNLFTGRTAYEKQIREYCIQYELVSVGTLLSIRLSNPVVGVNMFCFCCEAVVVNR